jgi:hypothetical protein
MLAKYVGINPATTDTGMINYYPGLPGSGTYKVLSDDADIPTFYAEGGVPYWFSVSGSMEWSDSDLSCCMAYEQAFGENGPWYAYPYTDVRASQAFALLGSPVPEPSTWALMLAGFVGVGFAGYRASRRSAEIAVV